MLACIMSPISALLLLPERGTRRALPHYSESDAEEEEQQDRKQQPSTKNKRSAGLALHSSGSNGEGDVEPGGAAGKKVCEGKEMWSLVMQPGVVCKNCVQAVCS
eukprot:1161441-Pelagomonas_calceolata.AAC.4